MRGSGRSAVSGAYSIYRPARREVIRMVNVLALQELDEEEVVVDAPVSTVSIVVCH
jgi:hypothetical protein